MTRTTIRHNQTSTARLRKRLAGFALGSLALLTCAAAPISAAHADSVKAPLSLTGTVIVHHPYVLQHAFKAGQPAHVAVSAEQLAVVTVQVYDQNHHCVAKREIDQNPFVRTDPTVSWRPKHTGTFTIKITTAYLTPLRFVLKTN